MFYIFEYACFRNDMNVSDFFLYKWGPGQHFLSISFSFFSLCKKSYIISLTPLLVLFFICLYISSRFFFFFFFFFYIYIYIFKVFSVCSPNALEALYEIEFGLTQRFLRCSKSADDGLPIL